MMTDEKIEKVTKVTMSRGMKDEVSIDLEKVEDLIVYDEFGETIRFRDLYYDQKTVIVFTRHLLCFTCKEYVDDLALVPPDLLKEVGVNLVVICPAPHKFIKEFRRETRCPHPIYADPDCVVYAGLGLKLAKRGDSSQRVVGSSVHVKSHWLSGILKTSWRAMNYQSHLGDVRQNGGCLIAGPGNTLHFSHVDNGIYDHTPINEFLTEVGARTVSFPKDPRVETV